MNILLYNEIVIRNWILMTLCHEKLISKTQPLMMGELFINFVHISILFPA